MRERPSVHDAGDVPAVAEVSVMSARPGRERADAASAATARGFHTMEETIRLVCPECDAIHRVKQITLGKLYRCKKCKAGLITMSPAMLVCPRCDARTPPAHVEVSRLITCDRCEESPLMQVEFQQVPRPVREVRTVAEPAALDVQADLVAEDVSPHNVNVGSEDEEGELEEIARALAEAEAETETDGQEAAGAFADVFASPDGGMHPSYMEQDDTPPGGEDESDAHTALPEGERVLPGGASGATANAGFRTAQNTASAKPDAEDPAGRAHPTHHPDVEAPHWRSSPSHPAATPGVRATPDAGARVGAEGHAGTSAVPLQVPALAGAGQNDRAVAALKSVLDDLQKPLLAEIERSRWSISLWVPLLALLPLAALIGWLFSELGEANEMKKRLIHLQESQRAEQELMTHDFEKLYRELHLLRRENESLRQENEALKTRGSRSP